MHDFLEELAVSFLQGSGEAFFSEIDLSERLAHVVLKHEKRAEVEFRLYCRFIHFLLK